tara:strand:- start:307 stop:1380 length:1074 start_codon:yes stop_codon:yes gene_type:complete
MRKTSLYNNHVGLGAKLISFSGFEMPVNYQKGIMHEYNSVRQECGIFDVSHMGQFFILGNDAYEFLQKVTINDVSKLNDYDAQYSAMCNYDGGIIDDLILYKCPDGYFMVVNAGNIDKNLDWLNKNIEGDVEIKNQSIETSLIAVQGPKTRHFLSQIISEEMLHIDFYSYQSIKLFDHDVMLSRTGYTGELGFEIYGHHESIIKVWEELIRLGVSPCGLACRDILRMEMKYCLYGNDINENITPLEAGLSWITAMNKESFIGKDKLIENSQTHKLVAFKMLDRGIPRKNYEIKLNGFKVGYVTSGTQSFKLGVGIGLGYVDVRYSTINNDIDIVIRDREFKAKIIKPPFLKDTSLLK